MNIEIKITVNGNAAQQWNEVKAFCQQRAIEIATTLNALNEAHQKECGEPGPREIVVGQPTNGNGWDHYVWRPGSPTLVGANGVPELQDPTWAKSLSWAKRLAEQLLAFQPAQTFEDQARA